MGRKREVVYYGNHLIGKYLDTKSADRLLKLHEMSENRGSIESLKDAICVLNNEQIDEIILNRNSDVVADEDILLGQLSDLQTIGVAYMYTAKRLVLGDSVGLGKTVQIAGLIRYLSKNAEQRGETFRVLYLTEKNLVKQTVKELIKFSGQYFEEVEGLKKSIEGFMSRNYDSYVNVCGSHSLSQHNLFHKWCSEMEDSLGKFPFDMIVVDESGSILTNDSTTTYKTARLLADKADYVIAVNATSFEKNLDKFRSQLAFVDPTFLFTKTEFNKKYLNYSYHSGRFASKNSYKNAEDFKEKVKLRYLKRTRVDQGAVIENCSAKLIVVPKSPIQQQLLKESSLPRMVIDCPTYFDKRISYDSVNVPKAAALLSLLQGELRGAHQVLVYTVLKEPHTYLKEFLRKNGIEVDIMNGSTNIDDRNKIINSFKRGDIRILITNVQRGLNFGSCNHVIFFDFDPNPGSMVQFEGRVTRDFNIMNKHVYVIVSSGQERLNLVKEVSRASKASRDFAGSDYSMVMELLEEQLTKYEADAKERLIIKREKQRAKERNEEYISTRQVNNAQVDDVYTGLKDYSLEGVSLNEEEVEKTNKINKNLSFLKSLSKKE